MSSTTSKRYVQRINFSFYISNLIQERNVVGQGERGFTTVDWTTTTHRKDIHNNSENHVYICGVITIFPFNVVICMNYRGKYI